MGLCLSVTSRSSTKTAKRRITKKQNHTIALGLQFSGAKDLRENRPESPPTRAPNAGGVGQNRRLVTHRPTLTLQLHNFDLFRTCRTSSFWTVAWQLARFQLTRGKEAVNGCSSSSSSSSDAVV